MSFSSTVNKVQYTANGATTVFAFGYLFYNDSDLVVKTTDLTTGISTTKTLTTHYTVSGSGSGSGGNVTFLVAPANGLRVTIERKVPLTQTSVYVLNDNFPSTVTEKNLDKAMQAVQQIKNQADGCLQYPSTEAVTDAMTILPLAAQRASKQLGFDADGNLSLVTDAESSATAAAASASAAAASAVSADASADAAADSAASAADIAAGVITTKGDLVTKSTVLTRLGVGSNDQVLIADSAQTTGLKWGTTPTPLTTAGDLFYFTTVPARLAIGTAGQILAVNAGATAPEWQTPAMFTTGDVKLTLKTTADSGWVLMNDTTIGNGSSGATGRANADTETLYTLLWNNTADAQCAVSTGRGANAAADFAANKTIALPKALGRALATYGSGSGLTARALALATGTETHTLDTTEMPAHTHTVAVSSVASSTGASNPAILPTGSMNTGSAGGGVAHNNMQPTLFLNIMIKL